MARGGTRRIAGVLADDVRAREAAVGGAPSSLWAAGRRLTDKGGRRDRREAPRLRHRPKARTTAPDGVAEGMGFGHTRRAPEPAGRGDPPGESPEAT